MFNKITLLRGATALLYLGPLMAGLAGGGWALVPFFSLFFVLWLVFLRPELWSDTRPVNATGPAWLPLASRAAVQVFLVTIYFGTGRGLGGVLGFAESIPFWLPVVLSCGAILIGRLVWNPQAGLPPGRGGMNALDA